MEDNRVIELVRRSLISLFRDDWFLLWDDVSERSVVHKLAEHLQKRFLQYTVDCEYNNDNAWGKKINSGKVRKHYNGHHFTPDIIIHKRTLRGVQTNEDNLCIIEVKLSTCQDDKDRVKDDGNLTFATLNEPNTLIYQLGIYIELWSGNEAQLDNHTIRRDAKVLTIYKNGNQVLREMNLNLNTPIPLD